MLAVATLAIALALAGQDSPPEASDALAVGDLVRFSPNDVADAERITHIASVDDLRQMKRLEAFMAHRVVPIRTSLPARTRLPDGTPIRPVPVGTPGVVEEIAEPGGLTNDARAARVRVAEGPFRGRALWVVTHRLAREGEASGRRPGPGDRAVLEAPTPGGLVAGPADRAAFAAYLRAGLAGDPAAFETMLERGRMVAVSDGTEVEVVGPSDRVGSTRVVEVRLAGGPNEGRVAWVDESSLRIKAGPSTRPDPERACPSPSPPAALISRAADLEQQGRTEQAKGCYRELLQRYPDAPEVADARERLGALSARH